MANGYNADYAVKLPNFFASPGEALNQAIGIKERQKDRDFEMQQYNQRLQQQNRSGNLEYIDRVTAFDKFKVGQQAIDNYSLGKLQEIQNRALTQYANLDPAEMRYRIQQDLAPLTQWDTMAKTQYSNIEKSLQDLNKTYPNINLSKAYDVAMNQFATDFMQQLPDGTWQNRNYMELQGKDYRQLFETPDVLGQIVEDESPFVKAIQETKLRKVGGKEVVDNKGNVQSYKWTGELSPFAEEIMDEKNRPTDRRIKAETVTLPNGEKVEMLPIEETKQLLANPAAKAAAYSMWNKIKPKGLDENTNDRLFRSFLHDQVKRNDLSYVKPEEVEKTPKPPSINIFNSPQNSPAAQWVNDMYAATASGNEEYIKGVASQLFSGLGKNEFEGDVFYLSSEQTGDRPALQINYKGNVQEKQSKTDKILGKEPKMVLGRDYERIYLDDPNIKTKLAGLYQKVMGTTGKVEDANFYKSQTPIMGQPATNPKTAKQKTLAERMREAANQR